jgi:hypothetical protein
MLGRLPDEGGVLRYVDGNCLLRKTLGWMLSRLPPLRKRRAKMGHPVFPGLLADAELSNDRLIALGIVSLEVVQ